LQNEPIEGREDDETGKILSEEEPLGEEKLVGRGLRGSWRDISGRRGG